MREILFIFIRFGRLHPESFILAHLLLVEVISVPLEEIVGALVRIVVAEVVTHEDDVLALVRESHAIGIELRHRLLHSLRQFRLWSHRIALRVVVVERQQLIHMLAPLMTQLQPERHEAMTVLLLPVARRHVTADFRAAPAPHIAVLQILVHKGK